MRVFAPALPVLLFVLGPLIPLPSAAAGREVVAAFSVLADMVDRVGGPKVSVVTLVGPGQDPHSYRPTPNDLRTLAKSKLELENGAGFEGWLERLITASGFEGVLVNATEGLALRAPSSTEGTGVRVGEVARAGTLARQVRGRSEFDPHAWQDPHLGMQYVGNIESGFVAADPANASGYRRRAAAYRDEIGATYVALARTIDAVPETQRRIVVPHAGFGYLARAFHVTAFSPGGRAAHGEISAARLAELARRVRAGAARAIFLEPSTNPRIVRQLARETGVPIGGVLYSDTLSGPDGVAPTYLAMLRHNIESLARALGGVR